MRQISKKGVQDLAKIGRKGDSLGIVIKSKLEYTDEWYMLKSESVLENETYRIFWDWDTNGSHSTG